MNHMNMSTTIFLFKREIYGGGYSSYLLNTNNLEFKKFLFLYQSNCVQIQAVPSGLLEAALFPVRAVKGLIKAADDTFPLVVKVSITCCQFHHNISVFCEASLIH